MVTRSTDLVPKVIGVSETGCRGLNGERLNLENPAKRIHSLEMKNEDPVRTSYNLRWDHASKPRKNWNLRLFGRVIFLEFFFMAPSRVVQSLCMPFYIWKFISFFRKFLGSSWPIYSLLQKRSKCANSSQTIKYYLFLRPFSDCFTSKPKNAYVYLLFGKKKTFHKVLKPRPPFSQWRQSRLSFEGLSCLLQLQNLEMGES